MPVKREFVTNCSSDDSFVAATVAGTTFGLSKVFPGTNPTTFTGELMAFYCSGFSAHVNDHANHLYLYQIPFNTMAQISFLWMSAPVPCYQASTRLEA